jgi:thioredoxin 1
MSNILDVSAENWEKEVMNHQDLVVVDFFSEVSPWCKRMDRIYDEVSEEYKNKAKFVKVDVLNSPENQDIAIKYNVMVTPTLLFICEGMTYESVVGFQNKKHLKYLIEDVIKNHRECLQKSTPLPTG